MAPRCGSPASGATCTSNDRAAADRMSRFCTGWPPEKTALKISRKAWSRVTCSSGVPGATGSAAPIISAKARLTKVMRNSGSTATTPSTMLPRMASRRALSRCSASTTTRTRRVASSSEAASAPVSSAAGCNAASPGRPGAGSPRGGAGRVPGAWSAGSRRPISMPPPGQMAAAATPTAPPEPRARPSTAARERRTRKAPWCWPICGRLRLTGASVTCQPAHAEPLRGS